MLQSFLRRVPPSILLLWAAFASLLFYHQPVSLISLSAVSFDNSTGAYTTQNEPCPSPSPSTVTIALPAPTCSTVVLPTPECSCPVQAPPPMESVSSVPKLTEEQMSVAALRENGIVISFKTGAQEVSNLAIHVATTLRYLDERDILFFSDIQGSIGPFIINDALRNVQQKIKEEHEDFDIYRQIHQYQSTGQDIMELKETRSKGDGRSGWRLDKYKFLHLVEETFEKRPNAKWYLFIETDSYVVWSNLVRWLKRLDPTKPSYLGSMVVMGDTQFAHGGSGYVISNAAMNVLLSPEQPQDLAATWDKRMQDHCCGDIALAIALKEKGIKVSNGSPYCNGHKPSTAPYGPDAHWCHPVVIMHHVLPHEISSIWRLERQREVLGITEPLMYSELFTQFVEPNLAETKENWDNMSDSLVYGDEMARHREKEEVIRKETEQRQRAAAENEAAKKAAKQGQDAPSEDLMRHIEELGDDWDEGIFDEVQRFDVEPAESDTESGAKLHRRKISNHLGWSESEMEAYKSVDHCRKACENRMDCFQFTHIGGTEQSCRLSKIIRLGMYRSPTEDDTPTIHTSGWLLDRIRDWQEKHQCSEARWE